LFSLHPYFSYQNTYNTQKPGIHKQAIQIKFHLSYYKILRFEILNYDRAIITEKRNCAIVFYGKSQHNNTPPIYRYLSIVKHKKENLTFGQRAADKIATFGGSWTVIISFFSILTVWIAFNVYALHNKGFDPYPFILLNLILSCLASIQAPIIMMSQNRQEEKDRERAEWDLKINEKAEAEIREISKKLTILMTQHQGLADKIDDVLKNEKSAD
jgi:uncharacterized membrane protein